eukprot:jgi/Botrbrau1/2281/Bobra.101_2s0104.1
MEKEDDVLKAQGGATTLFVELQVTHPRGDSVNMDRENSRTVLVPPGEEKSEGELPNSSGESHREPTRWRHFRLPYVQKLSQTPEREITGETPRAARWDPLKNWRGWSTREFLYLAGPALLMAVAYLVRPHLSSLFSTTPLIAACAYHRLLFLSLPFVASCVGYCFLSLPEPHFASSCRILPPVFAIAPCLCYCVSGVSRCR